MLVIGKQGVLPLRCVWPLVRTGSIAAGSAFGAMDILRSANIINTPVGQLIVAAAIIDDMIALVILSQLEALMGQVTVASIVIPIVSALAFLLVGGYLAIFVVPRALDHWVYPRFPETKIGPLSLTIMFAFLVVLLPATYYAKASYLMGSFIAGLAFCSNHDTHVLFVSQFKRILQWLMRIFFAASIGFQVPVKHFADGMVIAYGFLLTLALLGKLAVGFLVPNFTQNARFTGLHLRDCLITGFSMAAGKFKMETKTDSTAHFSSLYS